jgi:hypothetical protein
MMEMHTARQIGDLFHEVGKAHHQAYSALQGY